MFLPHQTVLQGIYSTSSLSPSYQQIAHSLQSMLDYSGDPADFEDTYMATFQVSFTDMFGTLNTYNLKEDGDKIPITPDNCQVSTSHMTFYGRSCDILTTPTWHFSDVV